MLQGTGFVILILLVLSTSVGHVEAYTCQIQQIQVTPPAPAPNTEIRVRVFAYCDLAMQGAIVSFFTTVVNLMPAGINRVIATEPIPNGSNDTNILIFTPNNPQLWNLTAEVQAIQTSGAGEIVSSAQENFTIPVGTTPTTNSTISTLTLTSNQTSTITELMETTVTSTQTTATISPVNPYLQLSTTILGAALVVTLFVFRNSRKKPEEIP